MSAENKTRFEIQKILRDTILLGLEKCSVNVDDFAVMEANQKAPTSKENAITFRHVSSERSGFQSIKFENLESGFTRKDKFFEVQEWEVSVINRRKNGVVITDFSADDIAQLLIWWFSGEGCFKLRESGVSAFRVEQETVLDSKDDEDLYQKSATFTIELVVPKVLKFKHKVVESIKPDVKPI